MNSHLTRAQLLLAQDRYDMAADVLRQGLLAAPEDARTHALLAMCLAEQEGFEDATRHAQQAVHLAPDDSYNYYALASVMADRRRWKEARQAIEQAIEIDPWDADYFATLSRIEFSQERWKSALEAAERGLAIDGEHAACVNLRAMAQVKLGDKQGAAATIDQALARRPDDPVAHANQGWVLLERGDPKKAVEHFREALRLNPEFEWARQGIVEALKAHNFVYRWMLAWFLWMAKLPAQARWGIIIGGYFAFRYLRQLAQQFPDWAPWIWPLLIAYTVFAVMTWLVDPFFNLLLRLHPWGRHALSRDNTRGANLLVASLLFPIPFVAANWLLATDEVLMAALLWLLAIPASAVYRCDRGWPRRAAAITTGALCLTGVIGALPLAPLLAEFPAAMWEVFSAGTFLLYVGGIFLSQFLMNYLMTVMPRK